MDERKDIKGKEDERKAGDFDLVWPCGDFGIVWPCGGFWVLF